MIRSSQQSIQFIASLNLDFRTGAMPGGLTFTRNSIATRFNASGVLETVAANTPRFDYDPVTLAIKGLLIEEARTNVLPQSGDLSQSAWVKTQGTIAASPANNALGLTAWLFSENTTTNRHLVVNNPSGSLAANTTYTTWVIVKAAGRTRFYLQFAGVSSSWGGDSRAGFFDLSAGTVTSTVGANTTAAIRNLGGGLYQCSVTSTTPASTGLSGANIILLNGSNENYAGDGTSGLYVYAAQFEQGAFPTSYIPTTSAAVTRAGDVCSMSIGSWYNQSEGTFSCQASTDTPNIDIRPVQVNDGTNVNRMVMQRGSTNALGLFGFAAGTSLNFGIINNVLTGNLFVAWVYRTNDFRASANGVLISTSATTSPPPVITNLAFGTGGRFWLSRLTYYPRRLPNAFLQSLTV